MIGAARANGAISVVNALATGWGASLAIDLHTHAKVTLLEDVPEVEVLIDGDETEDPGLARLVLKAIVARLGEPEWGGRVETTSRIPMSRGLKSSSAAANAVALATNQAFERYEGRALSRQECLTAAVEAALDAGVTITGAYDDASASMLGGLCVTDNKQRRLVRREETDETLVVHLLVPEAKTPTLTVKDRPYAPFAPLVEEAHGLARRGKWADALTLNGLIYGAIYGTPGRWTRDALAAGAVAAGVSGTGPAFAAVCRPKQSKDVEAALLDAQPEDTLLITTRPTNDRAEVSEE